MKTSNMNLTSLLAVITLTLLPAPAVWLGMYKLHSVIATFAIYHGLFLLPSIIFGQPLWRKQLTRPTKGQLLLLTIAAVFIPLVAVIAAQITGNLIVSKSSLLSSLESRGYTPDMLASISLYLIFINGALEELFWRGVIFNLRTKLPIKHRPYWEIWSAVSFAGWHFIVLNNLLNPGWALPITISFTLVGFSLGRLLDQSKSIILVSLWHGIVFDGAVIAVFLQVLSRPA